MDHRRRHRDAPAARPRRRRHHDRPSRGATGGTGGSRSMGDVTRHNSSRRVPRPEVPRHESSLEERTSTYAPHSLLRTPPNASALPAIEVLSFDVEWTPRARPIALRSGPRAHAPHPALERLDAWCIAVAKVRRRYDAKI